MNYTANCYPYRQSDIRAAASRSLLWLAAKNSGVLPTNFRDAWKLVVRCGLSCRGLRAASSRDGEVAQDGRGHWTIYYQARLTDERKLRVLIHELVEWLCITESPELMVGLPGTGVYAYDGGDNPQDVRHQAAKAAERMYLRVVKGQNNV